MKWLWKLIDIEEDEELQQAVYRFFRLSIFWIPFVLFPISIGLFFRVQEECGFFYWQENLANAFAIFGYTFFGCVFYALTGKEERDPRIILDRFFVASGWNIVLCILAFGKGFCSDF